MYNKEIIIKYVKSVNSTLNVIDIHNIRYNEFGIIFNIDYKSKTGDYLTFNNTNVSYKYIDGYILSTRNKRIKEILNDV